MAALVALIFVSFIAVVVVIAMVTSNAKSPAASERARIERETARAAWQLDQARHRAVEEMLNEVRRQQDQGGSHR